MKKFPSGIIVFDGIDTICISFSAGCVLAAFYKTYKKNKNKKPTRIDPMIRELKEKSAIIMRSETGKPLKLPLIRGGDFVLAKGFALYHIIIKNKKFANLVWAIVKAKRNQNRLMLV